MRKLMMKLLERAARSPLTLDNTKLAAFRDAPHRRKEPQLVCESGEAAERYMAALSGEGYMLFWEGQRVLESGEMRRTVDSYSIFREGTFDKMGEAEAQRDPQGKLLILAFEIAASEIITLSMIARALKKTEG
jgi:hypothetical protein